MLLLMAESFSEQRFFCGIRSGSIPKISEWGLFKLLFCKCWKIAEVFVDQMAFYCVQNELDTFKNLIVFLETKL